MLGMAIRSIRFWSRFRAPFRILPRSIFRLLRQSCAIPIREWTDNGNLVHDEAVFECTGRYPYADLYSVIPKGDGRPRLKKAKGPLEE